MSIEDKILKAISSGRLSLNKTGERNWYDYFIRITPLWWTVNLRDGYKIEVYKNQYGEYLATIIL